MWGFVQNEMGAHKITHLSKQPSAKLITILPQGVWKKKKYKLQYFHSFP